MGKEKERKKERRTRDGGGIGDGRRGGALEVGRRGEASKGTTEGGEGREPAAAAAGRHQTHRRWKGPYWLVVRVRAQQLRLALS